MTAVRNTTKYAARGGRQHPLSNRSAGILDPEQVDRLGRRNPRMLTRGQREARAQVRQEKAEAQSQVRFPIIR